MKVKCKSCGKRFDPDKNSFMCPKCGTWYVAPNHYDGAGASQATIYDCDDCKTGMAGEHDERSDGMTVEHNEMSDAMSGAAHVEQENTTSRKGIDARERTTIITLIVIVVMTLVTVTTSLISANHDNNSYVDDGDDYNDYDYSDDFSDEYNYLLKSAPVTGYAYGDEISGYGIGGSPVMIKIDSVDLLSLSDADLPLDYEIYDVTYEMRRIQSAQSVDRGTDDNISDDSVSDDSISEDSISEDSISEDSGEYIDNQFVLYLRTKTGEMISPMTSYDVDCMMEDDQYSYIHNINGTPEYDKGHLYFMAKNGDYEYMVVYSRYDIELAGEDVNYFQNSIENIGIVGDSADTSGWYDVSAESAEDQELYSVSDGEYIQKVEESKNYTLPGGIGISAEEIGDLSFIALDDKEYDTYIVGTKLINHGAVNSNIDVCDSSAADDSGVLVSKLEYGGSCESSLAPMSMVYSYVVVSVDKGKTGKVQISYQFADTSSGEQVRSVWIEL